MRMKFGETPLVSGTCFVVMSADGLVLVTNRHNFTGRDNIIGETLHKERGILDHSIATRHGPEEVHYQVDLLDHANPEVSSWIEHPKLGAKADIVVLPGFRLTTGSIPRHGLHLMQTEWHTRVPQP